VLVKGTQYPVSCSKSAFLFKLDMLLTMDAGTCY
jgi:hypothetical protein